MADRLQVQELRRQSPNVLHVGDVVRVLLPWASCSFVARVVGFPGDGVRVEAMPVSDDPMVENVWTVGFGDIGKAGLMDERYA